MWCVQVKRPTQRVEKKHSQWKNFTDGQGTQELFVSCVTFLCMWLLLVCCILVAIIVCQFPAVFFRFLLGATGGCCTGRRVSWLCSNKMGEKNGEAQLSCVQNMLATFVWMHGWLANICFCLWSQRPFLVFECQLLFTMPPLGSLVHLSISQEYYLHLETTPVTEWPQLIKCSVLMLGHIKFRKFPEMLLCM